jgi:hypothetical protein
MQNIIKLCKTKKNLYFKLVFQGVDILEISDTNQEGYRFLLLYTFRMGGGVIFYFSNRLYTFLTPTFFNSTLCNRSILCLFSDKTIDYLITNLIKYIKYIVIRIVIIIIL